MLLRSGCRLESLELVSNDLFDTEALLRILPWLPTLTDLSLEMGCAAITTQFFTQLTWQSSNHNSASTPTPGSNETTFLPRLENLHIEITDIYFRGTTALPNPDAIVPMIEFRQAILHISDTYY
ncbi:hypothetical protein D9758_012066 [Tetrapyrgos nigripes]|uniref:RNI-like protein n=1 Tax=Tetrapyrgos nigripes TaxID=182062 RepID=A0A8H5CE24_9AGAR|nr:hypothetical protein D9758_012066 [Tetrapyrgos nigripes]